VNREGTLVGHNTDGDGLCRPLASKALARGERFVVLGAGGAERDRGARARRPRSSS
jgi:shikimate 5-dehydrogenase